MDQPDAHQGAVSPIFIVSLGSCDQGFVEEDAGVWGAHGPGVLGAKGDVGAAVEGVPGLNFPLTDDKNPPVRSAIQRPDSPSCSADLPK